VGFSAEQLQFLCISQTDYTFFGTETMALAMRWP